MEKRRSASYHIKKALMYSFLSFSFFFAACTSNFLPIVKMERSYPNYPPTSVAEIVEHVPYNVEYIGKIKLVPADNSISFNKDKALKQLKKYACKHGARYIYITHLEASESDLRYIHLDRTFGDGITIEANLYR